jgi:uncharacterized protein YabE (DUF348 family)
MNPKRILIPVAIGVLIGLVLLLQPGTRQVTIIVEGQPIVKETTARTVGEAIQQAGLSLFPEDEVDPPATTRLKDGQTVRLTQSMLVTLQADGQAIQIRTAQRIPAIWLAQAGLDLNEGDRLTISGQAHPPEQAVPFQPELAARVHRAVTISLQSGSNSWTIQSSAPTLGQGLWEAGFTFTVSDLLIPAPDTPLTEDLTVRMVPGKQITVEVDGQTLSLTTSAETVGEALAQVGLPLQGLEYSIPAEESPVPKDGKIKVVRVAEEVIINQEPIPFQTLFQPLDDVEIDNYKVAQLGQVGMSAQRFRVRYEDGVEVSRTMEDEWTLRDPIPRIEGYGTQIVVRTENTPDGPIEYWRKVEMYATSYSPCNSAADRCYPYTSLGLPVQQGVVAVIYDWFIPMGNHTVYIPGYGHAIIADVGGGIPGRHWIDLGYTDEDYVPWAQYVTVYFTTPLPPAHDILYVLPYK